MWPRQKSHIDPLVIDDTKSAVRQASKYAYESLRNKKMSTHEVVDRMLQMDGEIYKVSETFLLPPLFLDMRPDVWKKSKNWKNKRKQTYKFLLLISSTTFP